MRRLVAVPALVLLILMAVPSTADANFWKWLDDLSGPAFEGFTVEWKVYCQRAKSNARLQYLQDLRGRLAPVATDLQTRLLGLTDGQRQSTEGTRVFVESVRVSQLAVDYLDRAIRLVREDSRTNVDELVRRALAARLYAINLSDVALSQMAGKRTAPPKELTFEEAAAVPVTRFAGGGLSISLCDLPEGERERQFLSLNTGWAVDRKDYGSEFANAPDDHNRVFTFGASYHAVVTNYLTVGAGAGIARFTSATRPPLSKLYVQAIILDFRPGGLFPGYPDRWWNAFYVRGTGLVFPDGFEMGSFGRQRERYSGEFVETFGIHADLGTLLKAAQRGR
jgi:hypothetical protein